MHLAHFLTDFVQILRAGSLSATVLRDRSGAARVTLGPLGTPLGPLGTALGSLGTTLGSFGNPLGRLGPLGGRLGPLWGRSGPSGATRCMALIIKGQLMAYFLANW